MLTPPHRLVAVLVLRIDARGMPDAVLMRRSTAPGVVFDLPGGGLDDGEFPKSGARRWIAAGEPANLLLIPRLAWQCSEVITLRDPPGFGFILTSRLTPAQGAAEGLATARIGRRGGL